MLVYCMVHDISPHDILGPTGDFGALMVRAYIDLTKYGTEARCRLNGVVQTTCFMVNEVCESASKFISTVEVEHAGE